MARVNQVLQLTALLFQLLDGMRGFPFVPVLYCLIEVIEDGVRFAVAADKEAYMIAVSSEV